jgi:hypothetical protein
MSCTSPGPKMPEGRIAAVRRVGQEGARFAARTRDSASA